MGEREIYSPISMINMFMCIARRGAGAEARARRGGEITSHSKAGERECGWIDFLSSHHI